MFRNLLLSALRNFARNRFYVAINVIGLAAGMTVTLIIGLFVRHELSYDRWISGYERTYLLTEYFAIGHEPTIHTPMSQSHVAELLRTDFADLGAVTRLTEGFRFYGVRADTIEANEHIYWADPNLFEVLPLPAIAGDLRTALERPDSVVLTRSMARKYFHEDTPIGHTLEIDRQHVVQVTAVLEDLPSNTHLATEIIASGRAPFAPLAEYDAQPKTMSDRVYTYVRLAPGRTIEPIQDALPDFTRRRFPSAFSDQLNTTLSFIPIASIHLAPLNHTHKLMLPGGDPAAIYSLSIVALLVLAVAGINFVNLMTARASRRAVEVGVRKAAGGTRAHLILQFLGESILQALLAMVIAVALVELLLPTISASLDQKFAFEYWRDPALALGMIGVTLLLGVLAGVYPAFVLSAFTPARVLKSGGAPIAGSGTLRELLVVAQFAVLIGLIVATMVIHRQMDFATTEGMRLDTDQVLMVATSCTGPFKDEVRKLPGVRGAACASDDVLNLQQGHMPFQRRDGTEIWLTGASVDFGFFELHGIRPLAGRLFAQDRAADALPADFLERPAAESFEAARAAGAFVGRVVMNETAVRLYGFSSPRAAVGQTMLGFAGRPLEVIGVVPDFSTDAIHKRVAPVVYGVYPPSFRYLDIKLSGREIPETLAAIDRLWTQVGEPQALRRFFLDSMIEGFYRDVIRRGRIFAAFAMAAVFIACLGLFALSAFAAERRTKEIGVRKALGAGNTDILKLLVWQFTKPVLWANVLAWPLAAAALHWWLQGFAYHVSLEAWVFPLATLVALTIALVTVSGHAWLVARANPARALRYD